LNIYENNDAPGIRFFEGAKAAIPILLGILPFGVIFGVTAADIGLSLIEAIGMDAIVLAGASQLAGLQLLDLAASPLVIVLTVWVINLRMVLYSASLSPYFQKQNLAWKLFLSWFLTDQVYAISISNFKQFPDKKSKHYFYAGAGLLIVFVFLIGTIVGFLMGNTIPGSWQLGFGIPLTFLVLVIPTLADKPALFAGIFAGVIATISTKIPYHLGLILAVSLAIPFGLWLESRAAKKLQTREVK
jgi:4-azaleucine resistance transporter AzlC